MIAYSTHLGSAPINPSPAFQALQPCSYVSLQTVMHRLRTEILAYHTLVHSYTNGTHKSIRHRNALFSDLNEDLAFYSSIGVDDSTSISRPYQIRPLLHRPSGFVTRLRGSCGMLVCPRIDRPVGFGCLKLRLQMGVSGLTEGCGSV